MLPFFNTSGPCIPGEHYMLPPERRLGHVLALIESRRYFTLHAGRQTGKTTSAMWLAAHLEATGRVRALWVDLETAREKPDVTRAMTVILKVLDDALADRHPEQPRPEPDERKAMLATPDTALLDYLERLAKLSPRPLVLLLDEADGLVGEAMVSFLTQLRHGYIERSLVPFPASVVLIGQRQVRDYALREEDRKALTWLGTTSPFNITAEAMTLGPFTQAEVGAGSSPTRSTKRSSRVCSPTRSKGRSPTSPPGTCAPMAPSTCPSSWPTGRSSGARTGTWPPRASTTTKRDHTSCSWRSSSAWSTAEGRSSASNGLGRRALDLVIEWRAERHAIEVKIRRGTVTEARALDQVTDYLDRLGLPEGWLVMFDLRSTASWNERLTLREVEHRGKRVRVVGC